MSDSRRNHALIRCLDRIFSTNWHRVGELCSLTSRNSIKFALKFDSIDVNLDVRNIEQVTDFKLLDITLDKDLSFNREDEELSKKF